MSAASIDHPHALSASDVGVDFHTAAGPVPAVSGVSLRVRAGEAVGIVGESGSGKSTVAAAMLGMLDTTAVVRGGRQLVGNDVEDFRPRDWQRVRGVKVGYVGQDPFGALNPVLRVRNHMNEALRMRPAAERPPAIRELLTAVELAPEVAMSFPHELSGGMRQRVAIAMAIANQPELLIADEPTTALDVTTQAEILKLLTRLRRERGMAILLISHDLGVVTEICERVYVMYRGNVVEHGPATHVLHSPFHPYTRGLVACSKLERLPSGLFSDGGRQAGRGEWDLGRPHVSLPLVEVAPGHYAAEAAIVASEVTR